MTDIISKEIYPNLTNFIENNCISCFKHCDVPSIELFACILKKIAEKNKNSEGKEKGNDNERCTISRMNFKSGNAEKPREKYKETEKTQQPASTQENWCIKELISQIKSKDTKREIISDQADFQGHRVIAIKGGAQ